MMSDTFIWQHQARVFLRGTSPPFGLASETTFIWLKRNIYVLRWSHSDVGGWRVDRFCVLISGCFAEFPHV